uniref:AIG1-type G domain-containing protein n=1 Tax=Amphimedon queenslandica TaxID=400682 RepID=A0A1X7T6H9_AMPQE
MATGIDNTIKSNSEISQGPETDAAAGIESKEPPYPSDIEDRPITSPKLKDAFDSLSQEKKYKIQELRDKKEPINILVIGPNGSGKSTIVNTLMEEEVAIVDQGAESVQSETIEKERVVKEVQIKIYDTIGFGNTKGKSGEHIVREIAKKNKFDLILICLKFDSRAYGDVQKMFTTLKKEISNEMWERSVIVLTFTNMFLQLQNIKHLEDDEKEEGIHRKIATFKEKISGFLSGQVTEETIHNIPFCIAGEEDERELPTTDDWLVALWESCIDRCSERSRPLLKFYSTQRLLGITGNISLPTVTGAVAGGIIGAGVGIVGHVPGMVGGAALGAVAGAAVMGSVSGAIVRKDTQKKKMNN